MCIASNQSPKLRVTFTRAESIELRTQAGNRIYVDGPNAQFPSRPLRSFANGEWFDMSTITSMEIDNPVTPVLSMFDGQGSFRMLARPPENQYRAGGYGAWYGTIEAQGIRITNAYCRPGNYVWYCPEKENDKTYQEPDNDEVWVENGVVHFRIHAKDVINSEGNTDLFSVFFEPLPVCVSASSTSLRISSTSSASSRNSVSSSSRSSSVSIQSFASTPSNGSRLSSSRSSLPQVVGGSCDGNECEEGGSLFCGFTNQTCVHTSDFPCITCAGGASSGNSARLSSSSRSLSTIPAGPSTSSLAGTSFLSSSRSSAVTISLETCNGYECQLGGNAVCAAQSQTCIADANDALCYRCETILAVASSAPDTPLVCSGQECVLGGSLYCGVQGGVCRTLASGPCFVCDMAISSATSVISTSSRSSSSTATLAFLDEQCAADVYCVTGLCINNICAVCRTDADCASGFCRSGICISRTLPMQITDRSVSVDTPADPLTGNPLQGSPDQQILPAQIIELPFTDNTNRITNNGYQNGLNQPVGASLPAAPSTPDTGPAALAVMLAGGAAGLMYRRRR